MKKQIILVLAAATACNMYAAMTKKGGVAQRGNVGSMVEMGPGPVKVQGGLPGSGITDEIQATIQHYMPQVHDAIDSAIEQGTDVTGLLNALQRLHNTKPGKPLMGLPNLGDLAKVYSQTKDAHGAILGLAETNAQKAQALKDAREFVRQVINQVKNRVIAEEPVAVKRTSRTKIGTVQPPKRARGNRKGFKGLRMTEEDRLRLISQ